jgi:hypothetical protein
VVLTGVRSRTRQIFLNLSDRTRPGRRKSAPRRDGADPSPTAPHDAQRLVAAYHAGTDMKQLSAEFGVHRNTVAATLRARSVPLRRQGLAE